MDSGDANCPEGGVVVHIGNDHDKNGLLEKTERTQSEYICNGADGMSGAYGANGSDGADGADGINGNIRGASSHPTKTKAGYLISAGFDSAPWRQV